MSLQSDGVYLYQTYVNMQEIQFELEKLEFIRLQRYGLIYSVPNMQI